MDLNARGINGAHNFRHYFSKVDFKITFPPTLRSPSRVCFRFYDSNFYAFLIRPIRAKYKYNINLVY
jgi:hypothetical protein